MIALKICEMDKLLEKQKKKDFAHLVKDVKSVAGYVFLLPANFESDGINDVT